MAFIYLAARYDRREEMIPYTKQLEAEGHEVTSRWIFEGEHETYGQLWRTKAEIDLRDIDRSEVIVLFTEDPETFWVRGSRHFELGYAFGIGLMCITVGPRENIFHWLDLVDNHATWEECFNTCFKDDCELNPGDWAWMARAERQQRVLEVTT